MTDIRIDISKRDLDKLRIMEQMLPNFMHEERLKSSIGQLLASQAKMNIEEGSPDGSRPYPQLLPSTVTKKGFSDVLIGARAKNTKSGALLRSIGSSNGTGNVIYLTALEYAKYHQFGTKKMISRPVFTIRKDNVTDIMSFIKKSFQRQIKNIAK
jgi:phage gpG-like protein